MEMTEQVQKELGECRSRIRELENELAASKQRVRELEEKEGVNIADTLPESKGIGGDRKNFWKQRRAEHEKAEREARTNERSAFVISVLQDPSFTEEQMEVVRRACMSDMPLEHLQAVCNPNLGIGNMQAMAEYLMKQGVIRVQDDRGNHCS